MKCGRRRASADSRLDANGLLPEGVHVSDLTEIDEVFGRFTVSDRRIQLLSALRAYLADLGRTHLASHVLIDGSFVTAKEEPGDIDLIVVLRPEVDLGTEFSPVEYNAISKRMVRRRHALDLLVAREGSDEYVRYLDLFQSVKGRPELRKGVLQVIP